MISLFKKLHNFSLLELSALGRTVGSETSPSISESLSYSSHPDKARCSHAAVAQSQGRLVKFHSTRLDVNRR
jgi:hypothetical protein